MSFRIQRVEISGEPCASWLLWFPGGHRPVVIPDGNMGQLVAAFLDQGGTMPTADSEPTDTPLFDEGGEAMTDTTTDLTDCPLAQLGFSVRIRKACVRLERYTLGHLLDTTADELLECRNFGVTSLAEVRAKLSTLGLHLKGDDMANGKPTLGRRDNGDLGVLVTAGATIIRSPGVHVVLDGRYSVNAGETVRMIGEHIIEIATEAEKAAEQATRFTD